VARVVPKHPDYRDNSERLVVELLAEKLPRECILLVGPRISDGTGDYEFDVMVLWESLGIGVIEIKGGLLLFLEDGRFRQSGRDGPSKDIDPMRRISDAKFALKNFLKTTTSFGDVRIAHALAIPYLNIPNTYQHAKGGRGLVIDLVDMVSIRGRIEALIGLRNERMLFTGAHVEALVHLLMPRLRDAENLRSLQSALPNRVEVVEARTENLKDLVAHLWVLPKYAVLGGAGTGRTLMALAQSQRLAKEGNPESRRVSWRLNRFHNGQAF
jgi:hypothetical protein